VNCSCRRSRAAWRTRAKPWDRHAPRWVGCRGDGRVFSWVHALPSPRAADGWPPWCARSLATITWSDSSQTCTAAVRLWAFASQSVLWMRFRHLRSLPVLVQAVAQRAWGHRRRGVGDGRTGSPSAVWPAAEVEPRRHPDGGCSTVKSSSRRCLSPRGGHLAVSTAGPRVRMAR
jgi:hypothetical protein